MCAYSKTQAAVALSSAEAALYAMVVAASEGFGATAMIVDGGADMCILLYADAYAGLRVAPFNGLGGLTIRHSTPVGTGRGERQARVIATGGRFSKLSGLHGYAVGFEDLAGLHGEDVRGGIARSSCHSS